MKITLTQPIKVLGKQGETVTVGKQLGIGLIRKGRAKKTISKSLDDMTVRELQDVAKDKDVSYAGLKKSELLKELKDEISTKEDKTEYKTK